LPGLKEEEQRISCCSHAAQIELCANAFVEH